jgi:hypothetical protein
VLDYLIEPPFASTFTVLPENLSRAFVLATIHYMFSGFRLHAFEGGNGLLTRTLRRIARGPASRSGRTVAGRARSAGGGETLTADRVVAPGLPRRSSGHPREERRFFEGALRAASLLRHDVDAGGPHLASASRTEGVPYGIAMRTRRRRCRRDDVQLRLSESTPPS